MLGVRGATVPARRAGRFSIGFDRSVPEGAVPRWPRWWARRSVSRHRAGSSVARRCVRRAGGTRLASPRPTARVSSPMPLPCQRSVP